MWFALSEEGERWIALSAPKWTRDFGDLETAEEPVSIGIADSIESNVPETGRGLPSAAVFEPQPSLIALNESASRGGSLYGRRWFGIVLHWPWLERWRWFLKLVEPRFLTCFFCWDVGNSLQARQWSDKVIRRIERPDWLVRDRRIRKEMHMMVTPRVVEEVRLHFNCSTLEGAELEDQGGEGRSSPLFFSSFRFFFFRHQTQQCCQSKKNTSKDDMFRELALWSNWNFFPVIKMPSSEDTSNSIAVMQKRSKFDRFGSSWGVFAVCTWNVTRKKVALNNFSRRQTKKKQQKKGNKLSSARPHRVRQFASVWRSFHYLFTATLSRRSFLVDTLIRFVFVASNEIPSARLMTGHFQLQPEQKPKKKKPKKNKKKWDKIKNQHAIKERNIRTGNTDPRHENNYGP